jgi:hypothetical protein
MSQKHKNSSKWAKQQVIYAKYSEKAREQVQEQRELSKELTKKIKEFEFDDKDEGDPIDNEEEKMAANEEALVKEALSTTKASNPWMKMMSGVGGNNNKDIKNDSNNEESKLTEFSKPKAFTDENEFKKVKEQMEHEIDDDDDESEDENEIEREDIKELVNVFKDEEDDEKEEDKKMKKKSKKKEKTATTVDNLLEEEKVAEINDSKIELSKPLNINIINHNEITIDNEDENEEEEDGTLNGKLKLRKNDAKEHKFTLSEAFADDDVIEEFKFEKVTS